MAMNLRGVREFGAFLAIPTYCFIVAIASMVGYGRIFVQARRSPRTVRSTASSPTPATPPSPGSQLSALLARTFPPAGHADRRGSDVQCRLLLTPGVMVTSVPYPLKSSAKAEQRAQRDDALDNVRRSSRLNR